MAPALILPAPLEGRRVRVRKWERRDRSAIEHWPRPELPAGWLDAGAVVGPRVSFAVDTWPAGQLIGRITLRDIQADAARIGIYLHPEWCNQGYGSEALRLVVAAAPQWGIRQLDLDVAADNLRAIRAYQKAGFRVVAALQRGGLLFWEMTHAPAGSVHRLDRAGGVAGVAVHHL